MTTPLVSIRNLSKSYRVYSHPSRMIVEALTGRVRHREFLALDNISFDVEPGSVVGLLGRNGAGKSTLLRIVARTLDATSGTVVTNGRIAAILELGTGFHPEYTGRENIYFGGICLGLSRSEMRARLDEIIAFSELEEFIDQPFRTYSSGMQGRLTFSVATCVDPDILIVDEALAVGDAKFQLKSFDRIRQFKRRGKAILLVSHSINQVTAFCDHAVLLDHGRVLAKGDPNRVGNIYHELLFGPPGGAVARTAAALGGAVLPAASQTGQHGEADEVAIDGLPPAAADASGHPPDNPAEGAAPVCASAEEESIGDDPGAAWVLRPPGDGEGSVLSREHRYGTGDARIVSLEIRDLEGRLCTRLRSLATYDFVLTIRTRRRVPNLCYGIVLRDGRGMELFGANSLYGSTVRLGALPANVEIEAKIRFRANLAAGDYFLTAALADEDATKHDVRFDMLQLCIAPTALLHDSSIVNLEPAFLPVKIQSREIVDVPEGVSET